MSIHISEQKVRIYKALLRSRDWKTARELADETGVNARTTRHHVTGLHANGLLEQTKVHGGFRYVAVKQTELSPPAAAHFEQLQEAALALGL